jgi:hypothetical protein
MTPSGHESPPRTLEGLADAQDLRAVLTKALTSELVDHESLRRGVWTYVGAERHAGTSPGHVIMALTEIVDAARIAPIVRRQALMRQVILWCVEAYFGHLGGDVVGREYEAISDSTGDTQ